MVSGKAPTNDAEEFDNGESKMPEIADYIEGRCHVLAIAL